MALGFTNEKRACLSPQIDGGDVALTRLTCRQGRLTNPLNPTSFSLCPLIQFWGASARCSMCASYFFWPVLLFVCPTRSLFWVSNLVCMAWTLHGHMMYIHISKKKVCRVPPMRIISCRCVMLGHHCLPCPLAGRSSCSPQPRALHDLKTLSVRQAATVSH